MMVSSALKVFITPATVISKRASVFASTASKSCSGESRMSFQVGLIGCGKISDIHLKDCACFHGINTVAYTSLDIADGPLHRRNVAPSPKQSA